MRYFLLLLLLALSLPLQAAAVDAAQLCREADEAFRQAGAVGGALDADAQAKLESARIRLLQAMEEHHLVNAAILYNLANIETRLGNLPQAILHYRQAMRLAPQNADIRNNLQYARSQRQDKFQEMEEKRAMKTLFFWHYDLSFLTRLWMLALPFPLLWLALAILLWKRPFWLKCTIAALALWCVALALSLFAISLPQQQRHPDGVITAKELPLRNGDGENYQPVMEAPLHEGTEVKILSRRGEWLEVQLPGGIHGWLPEQAVDLL